MGIDIERIRAETPGTDECIHMMACGSSLMPRCVIDAVVDYTKLEARIGGYEAHAAEAEKLDRVYDSVAAMIGASREEIALVENATAGWCHAFYALPLKPGDRILTAQAEYAANYVAFLQRAKRDGVTVETIPSDPTGAVDPDALEAMMDDRVGLIAITWIPTNGGLVNPAKEVGWIARRHGVPYLLDACQAVGQMPVDVKEIGCDFLSATGRKFLRGPRGTGFLYVARKWLEVLEPAMIDHFAAPWVERDRYELRPDARRFENWENSYALRMGLGAAVDYAMSIGLENIRTRAWRLADGFRSKLADIPGAALRDAGKDHCAIVSFSIDGIDDPRSHVQALRGKGIMIGASDPASTRLDAEARNLPTVFRVAPHYFNTEEEIDRVIEALAELPR